ncbi:MAG: S-layer homology domain-containing protein [Alkaliphilus sp.]
MKKSLTLILVLLLLLSTTTGAFAMTRIEFGRFLQSQTEILNITESKANEKAETFVDMGDHWGDRYIGTFALMGFVEGYADGTFRPQNNVSKAEFLVMVMRVIGYRNLEIKTDGLHWAENYVRRAVEDRLLGWSYPLEDPIFKPRDCKENWKHLNTPITRGEKASLLQSVFWRYNFEIPFRRDGQRLAIKFGVPANSALYNLAVFGLMKGYPDGTLRPDNNLTRAEAITVLTRLLDERKLITHDEIAFEPNALIFADQEVIFGEGMEELMRPRIERIIEVGRELEKSNKVQWTIMDDNVWIWWVDPDVPPLAGRWSFMVKARYLPFLGTGAVNFPPHIYIDIDRRSDVATNLLVDLTNEFMLHPVPSNLKQTIIDARGGSVTRIATNTYSLVGFDCSQTFAIGFE